MKTNSLKFIDVVIKTIEERKAYFAKSQSYREWKIPKNKQ